MSRTPLTTALNNVLEKLNSVDGAIKSAVQSLLTGKEDLIEEMLQKAEGEGGRAATPKRVLMQTTAEENIDEAVRGLQEARRICDRLRKVARNSSEIAKTMEKTLFKALKDLVEESSWYKSRFPEDVRRREKEKQYRRYRMRPDLHYKHYLTEETPSPEDLDVPRRSSQEDRKIFAAAFSDIQNQLREAVGSITDLLKTYFVSTKDNPLLQASNQTVSKLRRKLVWNKLKKQGIEDQVRILESMFGFQDQPGEFIEAGTQGFLAPAIHKIIVAREQVESPFTEMTRVEEIREQINSILDIGDEPGEEPEGETGPEGPPDNTDDTDAPEGETAPQVGDESEDEWQEEMELLDLTKREDELEEFDPEKTQLIDWKGFEKKKKEKPKDQELLEEEKKSELNKILERRNQLTKRQQRYYITQRIAANKGGVR